MADLLSAARDYLAMGFHPIPVAYRAKNPTVDWKKYQTEPPTDQDLVAWFGNGQPKNIALVLGRGVVAIDLDGERAGDLLTAASIELPQLAPRSRTANGYHVLLDAPSDVGDRVALLKTVDKQPGGKKPAAQVDVRGVGIIVAPPSVHASGHIYSWSVRPTGLDDVPRIPDRLLDLIRNPSISREDAPGASQWIAEALRGVGEGERDATCTRLAGYFLGEGIPRDIVRETLRGWAGRCRPPFPAEQVDKCVTSVDRKENAHPGDFQILGYNHGGYFYLPQGSRQVVELRAEQHAKLNLLRLAPLRYWEQAYGDRKGVAWDLAANALIRQCEGAGVYDISRIRGRGAWWDEGAVVLHVGDALVIGDRREPLRAGGRYVYEAAPPIGMDVDHPLSVDQANRVAQICELVSWRRPVSARLLSGWCAVAPICGALGWRPHVWLTGSAGTGKSTIIDKVVRPLMGEIGLSVQSETTEAGLRQILGHDARPVTFDEIEGEDERAQQRVQNVLALARQASSESGAVIVKGSPLGTPRTYRIRSCFAFSSIGVGVEKHADATRVTVLEVDRSSTSGTYRAREALVLSTVTDDYVRAFLARSVRMVPVIRANARTFAAAGAEVIGSQRLGDQVGALLAGAYSLFEDGEITLAEAQEWLAQQDWSEQRAIQEFDDEQRCLQRILEHIVRLQGKGGPIDRSVGELVRVSAKLDEDSVFPDTATNALMRMGIRVDQDDDLLTISNSHAAIEGILQGTPWHRGWGRILKRVPGARGTEGSVRFGALRARGVEIPLGVIR